MTILSNDIELRYSGGRFNQDPIRSVGGDVSHHTITSNVLNNLFDTYPPIVQGQAYVDYRAVYVLNNSDIDILYGASIYASKSNNDNSTIRVGVIRRNDEKVITFPKGLTIQYGHFTIKSGNEITSNINWNADNETFGQNIQNALNNLYYLSDVEVGEAEVDGDSLSYTIYFRGDDRNKLQTLSISENHLATTTSTAKINIYSNQIGSPINDIATDIGFRNNPLNDSNVDWHDIRDGEITSDFRAFSPAFGPGFDVTSVERIGIGTLYPKDFFAFWIERTLPANYPVNTSLSTDQFSLFVAGSST